MRAESRALLLVLLLVASAQSAMHCRRGASEAQGLPLPMSAATRILDRLAGVRQTSPGRWIAKCPAHEDKSPSLSIRELETGRILLYCFTGCGAGDVVESLGLTLADLFEKRLDPISLPPVRGGFSAREILELSAHEIMVASFLVSDAAARPLSESEQLRLAQAAGRITKAQAMVYGR